MSDLLELEFQATVSRLMWVLEDQLWSSVRSVNESS